MMVDFLSSALLQLLQQRQPVHPRHVDVGHHHVDVAVLLEQLQRLDAVAREQEADEPVADLPAEFLQDQRLEVRLVVDDEDASRSCRLLEPRVDLAGAAAQSRSAW